ncbi:putative methyltransferase DDB_G0268948 isoform X4 [Eriocheir sinensis]|uniref:putative methyltransferase DDB_G0268948 isoform X4 n=1 Tax=Eriocheir sinensis TaxID=95602 RepID=UPI0021C9901A|nr:putative methyltransferase DDB_G0268948 isoform X4 [Eriocheir sinensis]XP_050733653.1 putative methyltransferase DDB_G0268948 isoform X4 [Eriocheir sinensis]
MSQRYFEHPSLTAAYAKFRPEPPASLVSHILEYLHQGYDGPLEAAADVGCGSGQSTHVLAPHFNTVTGLDISPAQITEAVKLGKTSSVSFRVSGAESLPFPDNSLQLVMAGQACHWFDMPKFLKEVDRVLVPGGVVALYCYLLPRVVDPHLGERLSAMISEVYDDLLAGCWGEGVKDVNDCYRDPKFTIPYPDSSRDDSHSLMTESSVAELTLSMTAWSGFNTYRERNGEAAAQKLLDDFQKKVMTTLGVSTPPENTRLQLDTHFLLLMGRKPRI